MTNTKSNRVPRPKAGGAFPTVQSIPYEGPKSKNPLAFKHYNAGRSRRRQDDEGPPALLASSTGTRSAARAPICSAWARRMRPWDDGTELGRERPEPRARGLRVHREARRAVLRLPRPRRRARRQERSRETNKNLDAVVKVLKEEQKRTGIKLLWGTASLFVHPRFVHGAATSCNADVFAYAAAQVKKAHRSHARTRRRGLRLLGRPRRLHARC